MRKARAILGMIILIISLALLVWGLLRPRHEIRTQPIPPAELQLPTPASFLDQPELVVSFYA
ncbi:MAG: hypothetical protein ACM33V_05480 [Chloroflexota bacterium]